MPRERLGSKKKKTISRTTHILTWALIGSIVVLLVLIVLVLRRPFLQMNTPDIQGNDIVKDHDIQFIVDEHFQSYWMGLIPRSSIFAFPKKRIEASLAEQLPRLDTIAIGRIGLREFRIRVTEYLPAYLWCQEHEGHVDTCYYVGRDGYVFSDAPYFSDYVYLKFYDETRSDAPLREFVFTEEEFLTLIELRNQLTMRGIHIYQVRAGDARDFSLSLAYINDYLMGVESELMINLALPLEETLRTIDIIIDQERFINRLDNGDVLDYIDVRFERRALYKFIDQ